MVLTGDRYVFYFGVYFRCSFNLVIVLVVNLVTLLVVHHQLVVSHYTLREVEANLRFPNIPKSEQPIFPDYIGIMLKPPDSDGNCKMQIRHHFCRMKFIGKPLGGGGGLIYCAYK